MAIISFNNLATIGLVKDIGSENLPSDANNFAWTNAQNMRFANGAVIKMSGYSPMTTCSVPPYYSQRVNNGDASYYVYCGLSKIYALYSGTHYNITRQTASVDVNYSGDSSNEWNSTTINGFPIFNNGFDIPQAWTDISTSARLVNLPNWPTGYKASVIRSYKAYLIALDITDNTPKRNSSLIKWSNAALPGQIPTSWDITNPSEDAGELQISDSTGDLVDCLPLNDYNIIYKNTSTYVMSYVGGNAIFSVKKVFPNVGMLAKNCAAAFDGKHFVLTTDDVIVHDGFSYASVIDGKNKTFLFNLINASNYNSTFVVPNYAQSEMWICIPTGNSVFPNFAFIFNYKTGVWTTRTLPETPHIGHGFVDITQSPTWDEATGTWSEATYPFDRSAYNTTSWTLSMCVPSESELMIIDKNDLTDNGQSTYCFLERENIFINEDQNIKLIKRIYPKVSLLGGANKTINIHIGSSMTRGEATTWQGPFVFDASKDHKIDCLVSGRYISIRFSSATDILWKLDNFDMELVNKGTW